MWPNWLSGKPKFKSIDREIQKERNKLNRTLSGLGNYAYLVLLKEQELDKLIEALSYFVETSTFSVDNPGNISQGTVGLILAECKDPRSLDELQAMRLACIKIKKLKDEEISVITQLASRLPASRKEE